MLTQADEENYGPELLDMSRRAALDALTPELQRLHAENQQLRHLQQRSQRAEIERALDQSEIDWRQVYSDPSFAQWLSLPDDYSGGIRSQLLRNAVANGDAHRVVQFYRGFQAAAGQHGQARSYRSRPAARGAKPVYTRPQIAKLYEQRRLGHINDARWSPIESDIVKGAAEGRVVGAVGPDGTEISRWAR